MAQKAKVIDVTKTFIPVDPKAFPETLMATKQEDYPIDVQHLAAYEGYNFLGTPYGYKSYFGIDAELGINALPANCDKIFIFQTQTFKNILVALCDSGVWSKFGGEAGAWVNSYPITPPEEGSGLHYNWTYCLISEAIYAYRAGYPNAIKLEAGTFYDPAPAGTLGSITYNSFAVATGFPAGDYEFCLSYRNAAGRWTVPSAWTARTLAVASAISLSFVLPTGADLFRVYWKQADGIIHRAETDEAYEITGSYPNISVELIYAYSAPKGVVESLALDTDLLLTEDYQVTAHTPNFLNMTGQLGIFRAGQRLGFWDSEDSISWSSIDDFTEFTPSLETLAGSAIFGDMLGRIVSIISHGDGFIIYATRSILNIRQNLEATFQWEPKVILADSGIAYPEQAVSAVPDTLHFAWTSTGLYKIDTGKEEVIVPEVTHYLQETQQPIFLDVLEGRYLCLSILNEAWLAAQTQFSVGHVGDITYTFPGSSYIEDIEASGPVINMQEYCALITNWGATSDQQEEAEAERQAQGKPAPAPTSNPNSPTYQPVYTAYFSFHDVDPGNITWGADPCTAPKANGGDFNQCPVNPQLLSTLSATTAGKLVVADTTMDTTQFMATQEALWKIEDGNREAYLNAILARSGSDSKTEDSALNTNSDAAPNSCHIGAFPSKFVHPTWNIGECWFAVYRWMVEAKDVFRMLKTRVVSTSMAGDTMPATPSSVFVTLAPDVPPAEWPNILNMSPSEGMAYLVARRNHYYPIVNPLVIPPLVCTLTSIIVADAAGSGGSGSMQVDGVGNTSVGQVGVGLATATWNYVCPVGWDFVNIGGAPMCKRTSGYSKTTTVRAWNRAAPAQVSLQPDVGMLVLTGWKYTDVNAVEQTVTKGACSPPTAPTPPRTPVVGSGAIGASQAPKFGTNPFSDLDGSICGKPYVPIVIDGLFDNNPIEWPDTTVTLPGSSFLLQNGSVGPVYPTFVGMLVYDLQLKKWGKMKGQYSRLLNYSPLNAHIDGIIPYETFGMNAGVLKPSGKISLFDQYPADSYIKYGKLGYYRLGMTDLEEFRVDFRTPSTGYILAEGSINGRETHSLVNAVEAFTAASQVTLPANLSARWYNITIGGQFDIQYMEFRGEPAGRR